METLISNFLAHGYCFAWQTELVWLHVLADSFIALAYFSIPAAMLFFLYKRPDIKLPTIVILYATFILACGVTHIVNIWTVWNPDYFFQGWVKGFTAVVSVLTAIALIPTIKLALGLPTQAQLEAEIEQRKRVEAELENNIATLKHANNELDHFARFASHDLKAPLRRIANFCQLVQSRADENLDDSLKHYLHRAIENANGLQEDIEDLLTFSRLDQEKPGQIEVVDLKEILDAVLVSLSGADELGQQLSAKVEVEHLPKVSGFSIPLRHLLMNLLENAFKYGGLDNTHVKIATELRGERWHFSVTDNGPGIEEQYLDRLFQPFFRATNDKRGTGLGLALCEKVVMLHGGKLTVESTVGEGTTFRFDLQTA